MQRRTAVTPDFRKLLTAFDCVALGHAKGADVGIDRQEITRMFDHDDRDAVGILGDRRHKPVIGGLDRRAGCGRDVDAIVATLGIFAHDIALDRKGHAALFRRRLGLAQVWRGGGLDRRRLGHGNLIRQRFGGTGRRRRRRSGPRRGHDRRLARIKGGCGFARKRHRDQQELPLAHGKIGAKTVPIGEASDRHIVKPRDGKGGFAARNLVAHRLDPDAGRGFKRRGFNLLRIGALNGAIGQRRDIHARRRQDRPAARLGHATGQGDHLARAQRVAGLDAV